MSQCLARVAFYAALLAAPACRTADPDLSNVAEAGLQVGGLKGAAVIEATIRNRIFLPNVNYYYLGSYVGDFSANGLLSLLGGYSATLGTSSLKNATPNSVNMMLWRIAMIGSAKFLGGLACKPNVETLLNPHFFAASHALCSAAIASGMAGNASGADAGSGSGADAGLGSTTISQAERETLLKNFWLAVMRYDAPQTEMTAWIDEMGKAGSPLDTMPADQLLPYLMQTILMNPYFLVLH